MEQQRNLIQRVAVGDIIARTARRYPDREAVMESRGGRDIQLSYRELDRQVSRLARAMRGLGLQKGDRVVTICGNSVEFVVTIYGLARGGFVWVPVNPGLSPEDAAYIIRHAEARVVVVDDLFYPVLKDVLSEIKEIRNFIYLPVGGRSVPQPFTEFSSFIKDWPEDPVEDVEIWDRDLCQIMYTSGTTAAPKGVMISHLSIFVGSLNNAIEMDIGSNTVLSCLMPLFHCAQHTFATAVLHLGGRVVVMRGFEAMRLLDTIQREKITWLFALPGMYRAMLDHPGNGSYELSSLQTCVYAMTPMDRRTLEQAIERFGNRFMLATGQTECYPSTNSFKPEWQLLKEGNYWGVSAPAVDTAVMDDEGNLLPPGEVGEIVWRGPVVMEGYLKDPESTEAARKYGWHHSGDLGYFDRDGLLVFVDRNKDMIKTGGENVPSIKVERVILADTRVEACAVVGLSHPRWIEAVTALVVPRQGVKLQEDDIISYCKSKLGGFEVPKKVVFLEDLPRTTTGKIQKHVLRDKFRNLYNS